MSTKKFTSRMFAVLPIVILMLALIGPASAAPQGSVTRAQASNVSLPPGGILIDHNTRDISQIPAQWIEAAKQNVIWAYGSTSHGTQIWTGAEYLSARVSPPTYKFLKEWWTPPAQSTPAGLRMGYDSGWGWDASSFLNDARERLDAAPQATAFMWSWCGQLSDTSLPYPGTVNAYLSAMQQLESEYPGVTFVYMTGHTDQWSANRLNSNNNIIRQFAANHDKALYDFADIESYLPDGTPYATPNDDCPWCQDWCDAHPGDCPNPTWMGDCAHSHSFNCYLKGQAFWWLSARLAGWSGPTPGTTQTVTFRSVGANDGYILESTEISGVGGAMNSASTVFYLGDGTADKQYRAILHFDLNLPANAVITSATLKLKKQGLVGSDPFLTLGKISVDIRTGAFSNNNILQLTDFKAAPHKNTAAMIYNTSVSNWYSVAFPSSAFSYINKSGVTQLRLRFQIDDNDNGTADYLKFYSGNFVTAAARPTLVIEYHVPVP